MTPEDLADFDSYMIQSTVNGDVEVRCVECTEQAAACWRFEPSKNGLLEIVQTARNHARTCQTRRLWRAIEEGKRLVRAELGDGHTPLAGEVEEHIPEDLREAFWQRYVAKYFDQAVKP